MRRPILLATLAAVLAATSPLSAAPHVWRRGPRTLKYTVRAAGRAARPRAQGGPPPPGAGRTLNHGLNLLVSLFFAQSHGPPDPDRHPSPPYGFRC